MTEVLIIRISRHRILRDGECVTTLVGMGGCPLHCDYCINKKVLRQAEGRLLSARQLLEIVEKDDVYFRATNGGVTFGGGEPLLNIDFIKEFKSICPSAWKINVETSLNVRITSWSDLSNCVDCLIVDIKTLNPEIYLKYTGSSNRYLVSNLLKLSKRCLQGKVLIRMPLIPNYNDRTDIESSIGKLSKMGFNNYRIVPYVRHLDEKSTQQSASEYGKGICNILKHIRKVVAKANGVNLNEDICPQARCRTGTCPKCENYLLFLTKELSKLEKTIY